MKSLGWWARSVDTFYLDPFRVDTLYEDTLCSNNFVRFRQIDFVREGSSGEIH